MVKFEYQVRFGDVSFGPLLHHETVLDIIAEGIQVLASDVGYTFEEIIEFGGYPFAPVELGIDIHRYPKFADTLIVRVRPIAIGERFVTVGYSITDAASEEAVITSRVVHVTLDEHREPMRLPTPVSDKLNECRWNENTIDNNFKTLNSQKERYDKIDNISFNSIFTVRTPHTEAVDLAYLTEYFRFISISVEEEIEDKGVSVRELSGDVFPFKPRIIDFRFISPIEFEDTIQIFGTVKKVTDSLIIVEYRIVSNSPQELKIEGVIRYGCFDSAGYPMEFPTGVKTSFENSI